jgi:hypothetical protein
LDAYSKREGQLFLIVTTTLLTVFDIISNALIIYMTQSSSELRSLGPLRLFIGSMACADLLTGLVPMPAAAHQYIYKEWMFGYIGCKVSPWVA